MRGLRCSEQFESVFKFPPTPARFVMFKVRHSQNVNIIPRIAWKQKCMYLYFSRCPSMRATLPSSTLTCIREQDPPKNAWHGRFALHLFGWVRNQMWAAMLRLFSWENLQVRLRPHRLGSWKKNINVVASEQTVNFVLVQLFSMALVCTVILHNI